MIKLRHSEAVLPSRVVVLGGSGFVGKDLVRHLVEMGITTVAIASADIDLCQPESVAALREVISPSDTLVFVSALTPDKGKDIPTLMNNIGMGEHVGTFLQQSACSHVVYISSDAVYEDDANPVREESCCNPSSFHGLMHLVREKVLLHALGNSGVPLLILRPSLLYGPGDTHSGYGPNRFLRTARADRKITLFGNGEEKRDHVYIRDLSRFIGLCITRQAEGVLNVATGTSVSFSDVAQTVRALWGEPVEIECLPRTTPIAHRHFDTAAMLQAFPTFWFAPQPAALSETIETMLASQGSQAQRR